MCRRGLGGSGLGPPPGKILQQLRQSASWYARLADVLAKITSNWAAAVRRAAGVPLGCPAAGRVPLWFKGLPRSTHPHWAGSGQLPQVHGFSPAPCAHRLPFLRSPPAAASPGRHRSEALLQAKARAHLPQPAGRWSHGRFPLGRPGVVGRCAYRTFPALAVSSETTLNPTPPLSHRDGCITISFHTSCSSNRLFQEAHLFRQFAQ